MGSRQRGVPRSVAPARRGQVRLLRVSEEVWECQTVPAAHEDSPLPGGQGRISPSLRGAEVQEGFPDQVQSECSQGVSHQEVESLQVVWKTSRIYRKPCAGGAQDSDDVMMMSRL